MSEVYPLNTTNNCSERVKFMKVKIHLKIMFQQEFQMSRWQMVISQHKENTAKVANRTIRVILVVYAHLVSVISPKYCYTIISTVSFEPALKVIQRYLHCSCQGIVLLPRHMSVTLNQHPITNYKTKIFSNLKDNNSTGQISEQQKKTPV